MPIRPIRQLGLSLGSIAAGAALVVSTAPLASAGSNQLVADPTTVHAGESVSVSQWCYHEGHVELHLYAGWPGSPYVDPAGPPILSLPNIIPDAGDQWTTMLTIPEGTAPGSYTIDGICVTDGRTSDYSSVEITVIPDATPSSTTTTTTVVTTTTSLPPAAMPATAATANPTYTG